MKPDVLFWFYKDLDVCENRLLLLRHFNPEVRIYALYGGPPAGAAAAEQRLGPLCDDFYAFLEDRDLAWKWRNGDRMITAWYRDRGAALPWETVIVMQWDMLALKPLAEAFEMLEPGQLLLSGYRPLEEVQDWWGWVNGENEAEYRAFQAFKEEVSTQLHYDGPFYACLFIVACLPRVFLERYAATPTSGFLEYAMPTLARAFGIPVCTDHPYDPWWAADPGGHTVPEERRTLNALGKPVPSHIVFADYARPGSRRFFHPYRKPVPLWMLSPGLASALAPLHHLRPQVRNTQKTLYRKTSPR
jgi:hypothetical protein